jgi:hypothetical protein
MKKYSEKCKGRKRTQTREKGKDEETEQGLIDGKKTWLNWTASIYKDIESLEAWRSLHAPEFS